MRGSLPALATTVAPGDDEAPATDLIQALRGPVIRRADAPPTEHTATG